MAPGPRNVMRCEEIDGLSGPAHPITEQELDCGCRQLRFPKLAKYATRRAFVGLICWIGIIQGCAQAYFSLTSSTIARQFQFRPNTMEWMILLTEGLAPCLLALPVAYWGDRIHRAAWTGSLVLLQSISYICLIIPHFSRAPARIPEAPTNITHLPLFAEDHPDLCVTSELGRLPSADTETHHVTLVILIILQIISSMGNIAYFTLTISFLDDNTRKRHVALPMSFLLATRIVGLLLGYFLAWTCLRVDSDDLRSEITSYREQIGAWWLGWLIIAVFLILPSLLVSWMPRRLPSEVVEQAAASILDSAGRSSVLSESTTSGEPKSVGDTAFIPSLTRLLTNKTLMCNIFGSVFCAIALVNFANTEDIFLEARFYVPRPSGSLLGFEDPLTSRIVALILRPIVIGLVVVISGVVVVTLKPRAKWLVCWNIAVGVVAAMIILSLAFATCKKPPIAGNHRGDSFDMLAYCNRNCHCSKDANFRPVCDSRNSLTFYSPCHAGCTGVDESENVRKFVSCSCIPDISGFPGNDEATEGPCGSACQYGWILFEVNTIVAYCLVASGGLGSLLIGLRSTFIQDKALAVGLWVALMSFFVYIPGKMLYWQISDWTCIHRGNFKSLCHLHDSSSLGNYLTYLTALLLMIGVLFQLLTFIFARNLRLYRESFVELSETPEQGLPPGSVGPVGTQESGEVPPSGPDEQISPPDDLQSSEAPPNDQAEPSRRPEASFLHKKVNGPLKYGPVGPGDRRNASGGPEEVVYFPKSESEDSDDDEDRPNNRKVPISLSAIAYRRLETNSDVDSSDSSPGTTVRRRVQVEVLQKTPVNETVAGFSRTDDIEFTQFKPQTAKKKDRPYTGDFNEVGIPIVKYPLTSMNSRSIGSILSTAPKPKLSLPKPRARSPGEYTGRSSSGFESSASDLNKGPSGSEKVGRRGESTARTSQFKPAYSTAL